MAGLRKTVNYFLWIMVLSLPFYAIGKFGKGWFPVGLPISALMVVCPLLALAIHLSYRELKLVARNCFQLKSGNPVGYLLALSTMPIVLTLTFFIMQYSGVDLPTVHISLLDTGVLVVLFFFGAVLEEIGWTGYATNKLLKSHGTLYTGIIIGTVWAIWHIIPYVQMGKESYWIIWQYAASVLKRIAMVWLFLKYGRNVLMIILFHMQINLSVFVFPMMGSHYDPFYFSMALSVVMLAALGFIHMTKWKNLLSK